jgi:hypothetical protein
VLCRGGHLPLAGNAIAIRRSGLPASASHRLSRGWFALQADEGDGHNFRAGRRERIAPSDSEHVSLTTQHVDVGPFDDLLNGVGTGDVLLAAATA